MNTDAAHQLPDRSRVMERWLRRRRRAEAAVQFLSALFFTGIGLVLTTLVFMGVGFGIYVFLLELDGALAYYGISTTLRRPPMVITMLALALALCFRGAHKHRFGMDYSGGNADFHTAPVDGLRMLLNAILEVLYAGPGMLLAALEDFRRARRLMRLEIPPVAAIVLWVFRKGGKAEVSELSHAFARINTVRIFPQLRDLPGVIWLLDNRGVLLLSDAIRRELAALLGEMPGRDKPKPEDGPWARAHARAHEQTRTHEQTRSREHAHREERQHEPRRPLRPEASAQIQAWYQTLNLPPFAPLHQVRRNYRQLVKIHHPDVAASDPSRPGHSSRSSDDRIKQINLAYHNILKHSLSQEERRQAGEP